MNSQSLEFLDWSILIGYFIVLLAIGVWASRKSKEGSGKFLAERSLRWHHIGFSMWGTNVGPSMLIASASAGFTTGIVSGNYAWYAFIFIALLAFVFAPRYLGSKVHTLPEFMGLRFANPNSNYITNQNEENSFFENSTRSCLDNKTFWELKNVLFPKLEFLDNVKEGISIITGTEFNVIIKDLFLLNNYISEHSVKGFSYKFFKQATRVEISPETDQTLKNYGNYRTFNIPGKGTKACDLHMKTPNYRTNIYPDEENEKMWITYIGTHMPTMEHPT